MIKLTFHTDPGHGWLEVPRAIVESLDITISGFSYVKGDKYFLEEDRDASLFDQAAKEAGLKLDITRKHTDNDHPIRGYDRVRDPKYVNKYGQGLG